MAHKIPQMVSITGSVRAGMAVMAGASADLKNVHLELGGKAPVLVFDDADARQRLEAIIHPLVAQETDRQARLALDAGRRLLVFDVPLLVESGARWRATSIATLINPASYLFRASRLFRVAQTITQRTK